MSEEERNQIEEECLLNCSKAKMIEKYIDELEESSALSELWCKSQQENKQLKEVIEEVRKMISELDDETDDTTLYEITKNTKEFLLQILEKVRENK